jgi:DNA replication protein DnaC
MRKQRAEVKQATLRRVLRGKIYITLASNKSQVVKLYPKCKILEDENCFTVFTEKGARLIYKPLPKKRVVNKLKEEIPLGILREALRVEEDKEIVRTLKRDLVRNRNGVLTLGDKKIYIAGKQGVGKTTAVIKAIFPLISNYLVTNFRYFSMQRVSPDDLERLKEIVEIQQGKREETTELKKLDLIIVDDLNVDVFKQSPKMAEDFIYLVTEISPRAVITISNYSLQELLQALNKLGIASHIISRIAQLARDKEILIEGEDKRIVQARNRQKEKYKL